MDKAAIVFDRNAEAQVATLMGHTKRVTDVCFHPTKEVVITCSADRTARVWQQQEEEQDQGSGGGYKVAHVLDDHDGEVVGATVHATGDFMATASKDKSWAFYDINRLVFGPGSCLCCERQWVFGGWGLEIWSRGEGRVGKGRELSQKSLLHFTSLHVTPLLFISCSSLLIR